MKRTITKINPNSAAKVISLTVLVVASALLGIVIIAALLGHGSTAAFLASSKGNGIWALAVTPFIYMIGVYFVVFAICFAFNLSTRLFGGIQLELTE